MIEIQKYNLTVNHSGSSNPRIFINWRNIDIKQI